MDYAALTDVRKRSNLRDVMMVTRGIQMGWFDVPV